jgi:hypothetical protein
MALICITRYLLTGPARPILALLSHTGKCGAVATFINLFERSDLFGNEPSR